MDDGIDLRSRPVEKASIPEVAAAAERACRRDPTCSRSWAVHAWAMCALDRPADALLSVDEGLRTLSANVFGPDAGADGAAAEATAVSLLQNRGLAHLQLGDWSGAVAAYEHAEKLLPTAKLGKMIERAYQCSAAATLAQLTGETYFWKGAKGDGRGESGSEQRTVDEEEAVITLLCATPVLPEPSPKASDAGTASDTSDEHENDSPTGVDEVGEALQPYSAMWHSGSDDESEDSREEEAEDSREEGESPSHKRKRASTSAEPPSVEGEMTQAKWAKTQPAAPSYGSELDCEAVSDADDSPRRRSERLDAVPQAQSTADARPASAGAAARPGLTGGRRSLRMTSHFTYGESAR